MVKINKTNAFGGASSSPNVLQEYLKNRLEKCNLNAFHLFKFEKKCSWGRFDG